MAKLRFQGEWKMWIGFGLLAVLIIGYLYVASRPPMEGGEYLWRVEKVTDARNLTLRGSGNVIQFRLTGLTIPESQSATAKEFVTKTLETQWVRVKTLREDKEGTKEGFLYLSGEDVLARMIRQGLGQVDREDEAFDVRPYLELEQEAKREKRGLWRGSGTGEK